MHCKPIFVWVRGGGELSVGGTAAAFMCDFCMYVTVTWGTDNIHKKKYISIHRYVDIRICRKTKKKKNELYMKILKVYKCRSERERVKKMSIASEKNKEQSNRRDVYRTRHIFCDPIMTTFGAWKFYRKLFFVAR
jgi:hypothetical protein